ncbi:aminoglycoside phosphotransferase family protein [Paenibacillus donghaensis]|uniref:phosphotransferase family protein n=1 Tax=Paenibacillus donghaensis TaxID=414771 RepID=UPI001883366E|nr:aminoglycoside phosphotransferase family protein [Paenibacillus donghaensis]MBE9913082.1 aminoglycoside phosphotransferase family protein [Paenibacillus donghaensis]
METDEWNESDDKLQKLISRLRQKVGFDHAEWLDKGYSDARKFILYQADQPLYLLRVHVAASFARRVEEFQYLKQHIQHGVRCPQPIFAESFDDLELCYLLVAYIEGTSGEEVLPRLPPESQFLQGWEAGRELKKIHQVVPKTPVNWTEQRYDKYIRKKTTVQELDVSFHKQDFIESYIENHFDLLTNSSVCFQHDDFHPSNLIFRHGELAGIIDFGRFDWGDPWEEFFKLPKYTCDISKYFAYGQILGYFNGEIPDKFWAKYNLFVALNQHATLIGGAQNHKIRETLHKIKHTVDTHDFEDNGPPEWYLECEALGHSFSIGKD